MIEAREIPVDTMNLEKIDTGMVPLPQKPVPAAKGQEVFGIALEDSKPNEDGTHTVWVEIKGIKR